VQEISRSSATVSSPENSPGAGATANNIWFLYRFDILTHYPWAVRRGYLPVKLYF
jgi:hypothetical protein